MRRCGFDDAFIYEEIVLPPSRRKIPMVHLPQEESKEVFKDWVINPDKNKNHPAPFPQKLVENCILLTTEENDIVLDHF